MVAVDFGHSEGFVSAKRSGLSAETDTSDGMAVRETLSTEDFEISYRSEDFSDDISLR